MSEQNGRDKVLADILLTLQHVSSELERLQQQNDELRAMLADKVPTASGWLRTTEAAKALKPDGVQSANHLRLLIAHGVFTESKGEIRNVSTGDRATWELYIPKAKSALNRHFKVLQAS